MVRLAGIEPTTPWFVAKYSIQLSYSREAAILAREFWLYPEAAKNYPILGGISAIARSAIAVIVKLGFTPTFAGIAEASITYRPG